MSLACHGCGARPGERDPWPFRCTGGGDDVDHLIVRELDWHGPFIASDDPNPFVRWRQLLHSWQVWRAEGRADDAWVALVRALDEAVALVDGAGFRETPLRELRGIGGLPEGARVLAKDETGNVSGSHKARHLFGLMIWLRVVETLGWAPVGASRPRLAIASCGNAALAAAVVARAADWPLEVFIPPSADRVVVERLLALDATITACPREPGVPGDPCYHRFQAALRDGALPFCCQGPDNGLTVEGGHTLGWELASQAGRLDRVFIQVGGGALASAVIASLREAVALGAIPHMPRIHAVQTEGGHPLVRAWDRLQAHRAQAGVSEARALDWARTHRASLMWPWETEPHSIAHGILDDETYDWLEIVRGMLETGGSPVVVSEQDLREATVIANEAGVPADPTGASGLAGLLRTRRMIAAPETVAVLLTGRRRE